MRSKPGVFHRYHKNKKKALVFSITLQLMQLSISFREVKLETPPTSIKIKPRSKLTLSDNNQA